MSDYNVVNGITCPHTSEQDKTIASVVLAGWQIVRAEPPSTVGYSVIGPNGKLYGYRSTRYTAALLAERYIWEDKIRYIWEGDKITSVFPK